LIRAHRYYLLPGSGLRDAFFEASRSAKVNECGKRWVCDSELIELAKAPVALGGVLSGQGAGGLEGKEVGGGRNGPPLAKL
jgi:hypothetical protein